MARFSDVPRRAPNQENLLLDYVHRLENHKADRGVIHMRLSNLRPFNRREQHIRAAASSFDALIKTLQGQLFTLANSDLIFIYKYESRVQVETVVQKVRFLFSDDPLLSEDDMQSVEFCTWYDVETEFGQILRLSQNLAEAEEKRKATQARRDADTRDAHKTKEQQGNPLTPEVLDRMEVALERADISNMVRRQSVCRLNREMVPEQTFSEMFISINDLRETLLPDVNLLSNRWLFQHLTETLDRRMLSMLGKINGPAISGDISFNLNVSTLLSPEFLAFDDSLTASRRGSMVIELQKVDIFADLGAYLFAREFIHDKGYRLLVDGLTYLTMPMVSRERLGADFIKVIWHPEMVDGGADVQERMRTMVASTNASRVVLCRVDTQEAVDFGRSVGIQLFQGRHVESLIVEDNRRRDLLRLKSHGTR